MSIQNQQSLDLLRSGCGEDVRKLLLEFNIKNEEGIKELDSKFKDQLCTLIFTRLQSERAGEEPYHSDLLTTALNSLRILSRDKATLEAVMTDERIVVLLELSGLKDQKTSSGTGGRHKSVDGLKVVFNMVFQSPILQVMFVSNGILDGIIARLIDFTTTPTNPTSHSIYPPEFKYFTMRIFLLITALCDTAPPKVRNLLNGIQVINNFLESLIQRSSQGNQVDDMSSDIICETLKVLYNLIHDLVPKSNHGTQSEIDSEDLFQLNRVTRSARYLLLLDTQQISPLKRVEIRRHSINLLTAIPPPCFSELIPELEGGQDEGSTCHFEFDSLAAVNAVVEFLESRLDDLKSGSSSDNLAPSLCALHNMAEANRWIRKYLKQRILPPLNRNDVIDRPEVGSTIRNKLCNLLTSPVSYITELVANLLFILCKESVKKLIKYTGYGNAAGLLANRGLMLGGKAPEGKYSDSETDSDSEDYKEVEHLINQVEGRIQLERTDPMEGMTDEQKEVEAMKLINIIDKMERNSAIRPCKIGPDGRPVPIHHVLQLQEALENPLKNLTRNSDDDSDSD